MDIRNAIAELQSCLGQRVTRSKSDLDLHGRSESYFADAPPDAVAYPETTAEVAEIVRICAHHRVPVIGWGTGTSLEGQAQAFSGGVAVDFSRMDRILDIAPEDMIVRVQPGVTRAALNEALRATGLFFPVDPGANASLGGMAATRASGTTAVRYGTMRQNVLALEVVTAAGEVIRTGSGARKSSSGYDLTGLFVGAEGTLGLMTELTLRLYGQPEAISSAVCAFETVDDAVQTVIETIQCGLPMARIELMDTDSVRAVNAYSKMDLPEKPHLLLEFHGSDSGVAEQAETFGTIAADHGGSAFDWATQTEARTALWTMRHNAYYALLAMRPGRARHRHRYLRADLETGRGDRGHPRRSRRGGRDRADRRPCRATATFTRPCWSISKMPKRSPAPRPPPRAWSNAASGWAAPRPASTGSAWASSTTWRRTRGRLGVMGAIKTALDPDNIMNPGKLVPPRN